MEAVAEFAAEAKEHLLREDRRLLGRLLGDAIREQVGEDMLHRVELIRQTAVAFRRAESGAPQAKAELEGLLNALEASWCELRKRAGADGILTYFALDVAKRLGRSAGEGTTVFRLRSR